MLRQTGVSQDGPGEVRVCEISNQKFANPNSGPGKPNRKRAAYVRGHLQGALLSALAFFLLQIPTLADDLDDAKEQFSTGKYVECVTTLEKALKDGAGGEDRQVLLSKALL